MSSQENKHQFRIEKEYVKLAQQILDLRGSKAIANDVLREALELGLPILAALAMTDAQDTYGEHSAQSLAKKLRPTVAALLEFLAQHDELPLALAAWMVPMEQVPQHAPALPGPEGVMEPDPSAGQELLDVFGGLE
jgi:hypothetical protein